MRVDAEFLSTGTSMELDTHGREAALLALTLIREDRMPRGKCCVSSSSIRSHSSQCRVGPCVAQMRKCIARGPLSGAIRKKFARTEFFCHEHRRDQAADRGDRGLRPTWVFAPSTDVPIKAFLHDQDPSRTSALEKKGIRLVRGQVVCMWQSMRTCHPARL